MASTDEFLKNGQLLLKCRSRIGLQHHQLLGLLQPAQQVLAIPVWHTTLFRPSFATVALIVSYLVCITYYDGSLGAGNFVDISVTIVVTGS
jgi:hypothetical protein